MADSKLPGELTWPKLLGTTLAAVVTAWLAGYLNLGGTLTGVAIGSVIATFGSAFFTQTIDKTQQVLPTVLVRTDRGTVVESPAEPGGTTVLPAQPEERMGLHPAAVTPAPSRWSQIHWKSVAIAAVITMAVTLAAISVYEGAVGRTWGSNEPGSTIANTVRGGPQTPAAPTPTEDPSASPTPTEEPSESPTPTEDPSTAPTPTATATPTDCPTATGTATPGPTPTPTPPDGCPTDEPTADAPVNPLLP
jgi:hypothetical protein